ncbi:MAG: dihydroorotate dehydrogenase electron transfer subunit [Spirochaetales bacterium]
MPLFAARIVDNREIADDYLELSFAWEGPKPQPGQFFTVRVANGPAPLLRRPFGFSGYTTTDGQVTASTIYRRRGPATRLMAGRKPDESIEILGPLGTPFPEPRDAASPLLVAGGVGVGPILYLADELAARGRPATLIIGARSTADLPRRIPAEGTELFYTTDDGSFGERGTSIDLLQRLVSERMKQGSDLELFLCGPEPMLEAGYRLAQRLGISAWVAMEQTMGCAVGACMGCAIPLAGSNKYARVCTEGPVFDAATIDWESLRA